MKLSLTVAVASASSTWPSGLSSAGWGGLASGRGLIRLALCVAVRGRHGKTWCQFRENLAEEKPGVSSYFRLSGEAVFVGGLYDQTIVIRLEEAPHLRQVVGSEVRMQGQTELTPGLAFCCSAGKRGLPPPPDCESIPKGCGTTGSSRPTLIVAPREVRAVVGFVSPQIESPASGSGRTCPGDGCPARRPILIPGRSSLRRNEANTADRPTPAAERSQFGILPTGGRRKPIRPTRRHRGGTKPILAGLGSRRNEATGAWPVGGEVCGRGGTGRRWSRL